jgi:NAD(P)-dependent dehydrogenase (short-subunit alcohol dehydrogenase family)
MARLMKLLLREEARRSEEIVVRPDHGRLMDIDKGRTCYAGYSYGGRLVGLAELRGLEHGIRHADDLDGKVVAVTGAAGVLCSALCEDFLRHGARVALIGRHKDKLEALRASFAAKGLDAAIAVEADVLDRAAVEAALATILAKWGRIDVLVNGAGGNHPKGTTPAEQMDPTTPLADSFFGMSEEGFSHVFNLNLTGTVIPCQVFGKAMCDAGGGAILNFCSMASFHPLTKVGAYGAAKAAVMNFTCWLATHLAPMNIRVNALAPGFFISNQNRFLLLSKDGNGYTPRGHKVIAHTPMRRFGEPGDLCGAARFLLSDEASFVTGVVLPVDGGFIAHSGV